MLTISNKLGIFCVYFPPSDCAGARVVRVFGFGVPALGDWCPRYRGTVHATLGASLQIALSSEMSKVVYPSSRMETVLCDSLALGPGFSIKSSRGS